jgi:pyruvate dehydrogenase E2 component (dihydrolipoamide acetyltransferase)
MTELTMPKLSDSMEQGTILSWLRADGDEVQAGEDLLEIETDKATVTHQAEAGGILQIVAPEGSTLPVGAPIARVGAAAEPAAATNGAGIPATVAAPAAPAAVAREDAPTTPVRATPLARRAAKAHGISLDEVVGTGPLGRVTRNDVLNRAGVTPEPAAPPAAESARADGSATSTSDKGTVEVIEPTRAQSLTATRMSEANATVPHFQVQTDVAMDGAIAFRQQLEDAGAIAPSFNDLIVKAAALALREHPLVNGSYRDGRLELYSNVNIGIAVAADRALVVPTISGADQKSLGTIAAESTRLAERVRTGQISPTELSGATFTVSNLGMYGMTAIIPVINPPQAAILGVGAIRETLARVGGEIVDRHPMTLTLSCDHRILDGARAAEFLSTIRTLLEQPLRLAL